jgi:hypothetical protein
VLVDESRLVVVPTAPSPRVLEPSPTDEVYDNSSETIVSETASSIGDGTINHVLTVNTTMDDEVEVKISSPLSAKENTMESDNDIENHGTTALDRGTEEKQESLTPRQHLRQSLEQVMEERDQFAVKAHDRMERASKLATSMASMMDRQEILMQSDMEKNAQMMEASLQRREYLTKLFQLEQDFTEQVMSPEGEVSLYEEQWNEMDVISADVEAMKN